MYSISLVIYKRSTPFEIRTEMSGPNAQQPVKRSVQPYRKSDVEKQAAKTMTKLNKKPTP